MSKERSIKALSKRTGVGPVDTTGQARFISVAQQVGMSPDEIRDALATLPADRDPNDEDWEHLVQSWRHRIDAHVDVLERLRVRLGG